MKDLGVLRLSFCYSYFLLLLLHSFSAHHAPAYRRTPASF